MYWLLPWVWTTSWMEGFLGQGETIALDLTDEDLDAAAELHSEAFDQPWSGDELGTLLAQRGSFGYVVHKIGVARSEPLGFVLARNIAGEAEILTITVSRRYRRGGLGRMLMDQVLQKLHADRAESLFLEVDEENEAALRLYKRLRFEEVGRRPAYYCHPDGRRTSALTLKRSLA
ncbi:GNAT family N-acetyltransferase [Jiella sp. MQZ9-1]|uniref:GNAT family N-acetyltransferase n=1 Tax=Jiella flava TaxID=2816857 RepID=A0A939JSR0_9HYPH|nr:GNAT family N-acetyltransferase [Jiella flava]MBO0661355.1 GNAT family N-acetyltransferase [Jiella flava]MCD2470000.1 GNAT family N-acetyltransferase [Jiella flava]